MRVEDVMIREVVKVRPGDTLKHAAALLVEHGISGMPAVADDGEVVGVLSGADILAKERAERPAHGALYRALHPEETYSDDLKLAARTVAEAMTWPAVTVEPTAPVARAAALMGDAKISRLPVVDAAGRLVGIVTRSDLVRAFVRDDEEIAEEIRRDVILRTLWIDPSDVEVTVEDGVVTLAGEVDTRLDGELAAELVRRVPGVVAVESEVKTLGEGERRFRPHLVPRK
jgi:CBS domain-containing protein